MLAALFDVEIGERAEIGELGPALGEQRQSALSVLRNGLTRRCQQAGTTGGKRDEEDEEASESAGPSNHA